MLLNRIKEYLIGKEFRNVKVNIPNIELNYITINGNVYVVTLYNCPNGNEFTKDQYDNIRKQLNQNFTDKYETKSIRILNLIVTENVEKIRSLNSSDQEQWIVDSRTAKLYIFENQIGEFLNLRNDLDDILFNFNQEQLRSSLNTSTINQWGKKEQYSPNEYNQQQNHQYTKQYSQQQNHQNNQKYNQQNNPYYNHNDRKQYKKPSFLSAYFSICNTALIILNVIVFLYIDLIGSSENTYFLLNHGALYWPAVIEQNEYYRLLTYMFLHGGIEHLVNNMIVLLFLGDNLERAAGKWRFLSMYFGSGILAGIVSLGYNMLNNNHAVSVGASGAIFGVVGAMAYIVMINKGRLENISTRQLIVFVIFSLYGGLTSQGVDNAAHIGGLVAGVFLALLLYRKQKKKHPERGYSDES